MLNKRNVVVIVLAAAAGCAAPDIQPAVPDVTQAQFVEAITHPYLPMPVGATWVYEAQSADGVERIDIEVLAETRDINGVTATQVRDTATVDGEIAEDTVDFYAQDADGNVWYLGEETCEFENGACADTAGSWQYGVDGALPGFALPAELALDAGPYYQEYFVGEAEDFGEIIDVAASATVPAGSFGDCVKTQDSSTLDSSLDEQKTYCRGVGNVLVEEGDVREELKESSLL